MPSQKPAPVVSPPSQFAAPPQQALAPVRMAVRRCPKCGDLATPYGYCFDHGG